MGDVQDDAAWVRHYIRSSSDTVLAIALTREMQFISALYHSHRPEPRNLP